MKNRHNEISIMYRLALVLLSLLLLVPALAGCRDTGDGDATTDTPQSTTPEITADTRVNLAGYSCVRADKADAAQVAAFMCVVNRMLSVFPDTKVKTDFVIPGVIEESENEIIFGQTSREESAHGKKLGWRDYIIRRVGTKIIIDGGSIYGLYNGARAFAALVGSDGLADIPAEGIDGVYDYGDTPLGAILKEYEDPSGRLMSMAHRGDWRSFPENSLAGIVSCIDAGVDIAEIDVRKTSDGGFVLMHDETLSRTTSGSGYVSRMTVSSILRFNLRNGKGGSGSGISEYKVPEFSEILDAVSGKMMLNLDKTAYDCRDEVYELLVRHNCLDSAVFKSGAAASEVIAWFADLIGAGRELPLFSCMSYSSDYDTIRRALDSYAGYITMAEIGFSSAPAGSQKKLCEYAASIGIRPMVLTLSSSYCGYDDDSPVCWGILRGRGFSVFMTENPKNLVAYIKSIKG